MNTDKISIQILDPAAEAEKYLIPEAFDDDIIWENGFPNLRELKSDDGLGRILLRFLNNPGSSLHEVFTRKELNFTVDNYMSFACRCKLIKIYNHRYYVTELGEAVLKQNGLID